MTLRTEQDRDPACTDSTTGLDERVASSETGRADRELRGSLRDLLGGVDLRSRELDTKLLELERQHGNVVFSELIHLLSHVRLDLNDAERHWRAIAAHRRTMQERLGASVDPRVALLDYFVSVNRKLENPKVIEMKLFEQTQASAYRDELTGLYNYRFLVEHLAREVSRCIRIPAPLSFVMVDVDDFKNYNDRNGHEVGNMALTRVARLLTQSLREEDVTARYGGEEFALMLPLTTKREAQLLAERARNMIARSRFLHEENQPGGRLTVSMGIATLPSDAQDADELVKRADSAMYTAKANGKNQTQLFGSSRRSHRRIDVSFDGSYRLLAEESHPLTAVTLSEGGLLFVADRDLPNGSLVEVDLDLQHSDREIAVCGRVIYGKRRDDGQFEAAVSFEELNSTDRRLLARYIRMTGSPRDTTLDS